MKKQLKGEQLYKQICELVLDARAKVYQQTNALLLNLYWQIGKLIVEDELKGSARAAYGKQVLKKLSTQLTLEFGKGFDESNLRNIRQFYLAFPICDALRHELSWTHYRTLSRIDEPAVRTLYMTHAADNSWDTRTLQRNIQTNYMARYINTADAKSTLPAAMVKDPYIFEFLGLGQTASLTELNLETALISHLQQFMMELGKGFAFVARQQHIVTDTSDFYIDLVFYNYYLKCFVLVDLKMDKLNHAAIGQMDMYVRMYNDLKKGGDDNPTIGIILCTEKDETVVKYSVLAENERLFASKYRLYMPSEKELKALLDSNIGRLNESA
jgi:predicted nuclease of restriction endonuclease-like (RecB) superfamily